MPALRVLAEGGTFLLLVLLPLVFSTHLADAVLAPKQAVFQVGAAALLAAWASGASAGAWATWPRSPVARVAFLLYAWWAATGLLAGLPPTAVAGTMDAGLLAVVVLAWTATADEKRARRWTGWVCAAALAAGLYSHLQRLTPLELRLGPLVLRDPVPWSNPHLSMERTIATFGNPDYLAAWLVAVLPLALSWVLELQRPAARLAALAGWALTALAMVLTLTRAAWVGAAVGGMVWLVLAVAGLPRPQRGAILRVLAGLGLACALLVGAAVARQAGRDTPFTIAARLGSFTDFQDLSFRTRLFFWGAALRTVAEHPLAGVGPGGFPRQALLHRELEPVETRYPPRTPENPHNQYLSVAVEAGLPGTGLLLALLVLFFLRGRGATSLQTAGLLGAGAAHWANQAFISSTLPSEAFWVFLVALAAAREQPPREGREPGSPSLPITLAGLVFLALVTGMAWRILASERLVWLGDDAKLEGRAMLQARRFTGQQILGVYQQALERYLAAAERAPAWSRAEASWRVGRLYEELYVDVSGEQAEALWTGAVEAYEASVEADPGYVSGWESLARMQARRPEHRQEALRSLARALAMDPRNVEVLDLHARILHDLGRPEEALESWRLALAVRPDVPRTLLGMAETLCLLDRRAEAEKALVEAVRLDARAASVAEGIRSSCGPKGRAEELQTHRRSGAPSADPALSR